MKLFARYYVWSCLVSVSLYVKIGLQILQSILRMKKFFSVYVGNF